MRMSLWKGMAWSVIKGAVELLLAYPLLQMLAVFTLPDEAGGAIWLTSLLLCYAAGYAGGWLMPLNKRYRVFVFAFLVGGLHAYSMYGAHYGMAVGLLIAALLAARGIKLVTASWNAMFPVSFYGIGLLAYFICSLVWPHAPALAPYLNGLLWGGLAALVITLLITNQSNMKQETLSGDKEPVLAAAVVWQNRILVGIVIAVIVIVVLFRKLQQAFLWLKDQLLAWLVELLRLIPESPPADKTEQQPMNLEGMGKAEEPAQWLKWLEQAFMILVEVAIAAILLYLLYLAIRKIPMLLKKLYAILMRLMDGREKKKGAGGYEDDIESLMDWQELRNQLAARMKGWLPRRTEPREKWEDMKNNFERIRFLYRRWIQQAAHEGYVPKRSLTPQETASDMQKWDAAKRHSPDALISYYEQARYGHKLTDDADIRSLKQALERNKRKE